MKHLIIYSVLFCIGFLNVPRALVHDCDEHQTHSVAHDNDDAGSDVSFDQDDCFMCEFQLDYFEVPEFIIPKGVKPSYYVAAPGQTGKAQSEFVLSYALRGPPAIA